GGFRGSRLIGEERPIDGVKARGGQQGRAQNKSSHGCFSGTRGGFNRPNTRSRILPAKHVAVPSRRCQGGSRSQRVSRSALLFKVQQREQVGIRFDVETG